MQPVPGGHSCSYWSWSWGQILCNSPTAQWDSGHDCHFDVPREEHNLIHAYVKWGLSNLCSVWGWQPALSHTKCVLVVIVSIIGFNDYLNIPLSQAPLVQKEVQHFQVEVRGDTFYSKQVRKVMIRASDPVTFIQTDKPIYLPGQKGNNVLLCYIRHVVHSNSIIMSQLLHHLQFV